MWHDPRKVPFYCRHCAKQYANELEFPESRETDFHKKAVEIERKATYLSYVGSS
jgi:hypothetical protein